MTEEEEFFAWLDGELPPVDEARVEARVAASATLTAEARSHRAMAAKMRAAFDPVMTPRSDVADLAAKRAERASPPARRPAGIPQWAAMAATLVFGVGLGAMVNRAGEGGSPIVIKGGSMVAAAALEQALTHQLASSDRRSVATRIGLTFRNEQGRLCRTFSDSAASGLACRNDDDWRIEGLHSVGQASAGDYRMAAGADQRLAEMVDGMIAGQPLDAEDEKAARQSGWK